MGAGANVPQSEPERIGYKRRKHLGWLNELGWRRRFAAEALHALREGASAAEAERLSAAWDEHQMRGIEILSMPPLKRRQFLSREVRSADLREFCEPRPASEAHLEYELHWARWTATEAIQTLGAFAQLGGAAWRSETPSEAADRIEGEWERRLAAGRTESPERVRAILRDLVASELAGGAAGDETGQK